MNNSYFYAILIIMLSIVGWVNMSLNRQVNTLKSAMTTTNHHVGKIEEELNRSKKQVSVLEQSISSKDKRWARIKQVRTIIQEDMKYGYISSDKLTINDVTSIAGSIIDYSEQYDVPASLIAAVIRTESAYNPYAISPTGALGLMQLLPSTAEEVANDLGVKYYNVHKISDNIRLGTWYLWKMLKRFHGDVELAAKSYNCGPVYTERVISKEYKDYPDETKQYIIKILEHKKRFEDSGL